MKKSSLNKRRLAVIKNIEALLLKDKRKLRFGTLEQVDSDSLILAFRALEHLKGMD